MSQKIPNKVQPECAWDTIPSYNQNIVPKYTHAPNLNQKRNRKARMVWYGMVWYGTVWYGMVDVCGGRRIALTCTQWGSRTYSTDMHTVHRTQHLGTVWTKLPQPSCSQPAKPQLRPRWHPASRTYLSSLAVLCIL